MVNLTAALGIGLSLRRILSDERLRQEFLAELVLRGEDGLHKLLDAKRAELDPRLYHELYVLLHGKDPPPAPAPATGLSRR